MPPAQPMAMPRRNQARAARTENAVSHVEPLRRGFYVLCVRECRVGVFLTACRALNSLPRARGGNHWELRFSSFQRENVVTVGAVTNRTLCVNLCGYKPHLLVGATRRRSENFSPALPSVTIHPVRQRSLLACDSPILVICSGQRHRGAVGAAPCGCPQRADESIMSLTITPIFVIQ
jgi:hypothetical protein